MWTNLQETADLVTLNEEILNGKLHFLCSEIQKIVEVKFWVKPSKYHNSQQRFTKIFDADKKNKSFTCSAVTANKEGVNMYCIKVFMGI